MRDNRKSPIWVEKWRPRKISECILPQKIKTTFEEIVAQGIVPNMILAGKAGTGKTTAAQAMCDELDLDWILINASESGNIDTLRTEIREFASTRSFDGKRRVVILDEADYLNPNSTQPALRGFIEEFSQNVSFIFTVNNLAKIIAPLHSRASIIEYEIPIDEKNGLMKAFHKRLSHILTTENVEFDGKALAQVIVRYWPDIRRTINECQRYAMSGPIDEGVILSVHDAPMEELIDALKKDDFKKMRVWCAEHNDGDSAKIIRKIYDEMFHIFEPASIPGVVLLIGDFCYKASFVTDQEINLVAFLTSIMLEATIKK